jgi:protein-arginine deiminase
MQPAEWAVAVYTGRGAFGNEAFIDGFDDVLGADFDTVSGATVDYDVWIQDELEYATMTAPGYEMQFVIDSIRSGRDQYLDSVPEDVMWGPDTGVWTWGSGGVTSQDSFGNLEVSPPVTVDGVEYPFGRVYYGDSGRYSMTDAMKDMLDEQQVQAPFTLDIGWLCVGHVDEFLTFLPNPDAPKGFTLYVIDTDVGRAFLEGLNPDTPLPLYDSGHGVDSIGDMLDHGSMWSYNDDLMAERIEPNIDVLKAELGLTEDDIIRVPGVFERSSACGGTALSLIPGTVNMQVHTSDDGMTADLFIPDPFLREDSSDPSSDPFIAEFEAMLPSNLTPYWLDDWASYHLMWGEVHCGSNTRRTPIGQWWTDARHLMED